jgi:5-methylcytosine-specific restriction endonuclease McrA
MASKNNKKVGDPFYKSTQWQKVRHAVLKRDNYTCSACRLTLASKDLQVDHIIPRLTAPHLAYWGGNLRVLCRRCHARVATSFKRGDDYKERPFVDSSGFPRDSEWTK